MYELASFEHCVSFISETISSMSGNVTSAGDSSLIAVFTAASDVSAEFTTSSRTARLHAQEPQTVDYTTDNVNKYELWGTDT